MKDYKHVVNVVDEHKGGYDAAKRNERVEEKLQHEGRQKPRVPRIEVIVHELDEAVKDSNDDAVNDVGEDIEHHLLEDASTALRVRKDVQHHSK